MNDVKSRVHGSENLTVLMHQHQLLVYATRFNLFRPHPPSNATSYTAPGYDAEMHSFLLPVKSVKQLSTLQFKHLQQHYKTVHDITSLQDHELVNMDPMVQVWHRYRQGKTIFHCAQNRKRTSARLNHLVCFDKWLIGMRDLATKHVPNEWNSKTSTFTLNSIASIHFVGHLACLYMAGITRSAYMMD